MDIGGYLGGISDIPCLGLKANELSDMLTVCEPKEVVELGVHTTLLSTAHTAMNVIYARGITEAGIVGLLTEPPFFSTWEQVMGKRKVVVQGVSYGAFISGLLPVGDDRGADEVQEIFLCYPKTPCS
ncbi:hypothetical protein CJF31_00004176 [Rutstroemia sp. NJR-2017a BVV2]|nr:hypothetical protein CJF31_00004176 [Rutstroemia sp. NJR-2017a BVV2]